VDIGINEAAGILGVSSDTIRRRLKRGGLKGTRIERPQGFTWSVHLDEREQPPMQLDMSDQMTINAPMQLVEFLQEQLKAKDEQIGLLIHKLADVQALPAPKPSAWWRSLLRH